MELQNNHLESAFRTSDGVFAVSDEQRILFWNQGAQAILGYAPEEVVGRLCFEVTRGLGESRQPNCILDCPVISCARQGKLADGQNILVRAKGGSLRWLSMTHLFLNSHNDHPPLVVHIFRDVSREVEAKQALRRIAEQLADCGFLPGHEEREHPLETELTDREKQVLVLLAQGEGTSAIATKLTIGCTTARNHIQNILAKLGVHTRLEAVAFALRYRLIDTG